MALENRSIVRSALHRMGGTIATVMIIAAGTPHNARGALPSIHSHRFQAGGTEFEISVFAEKNAALGAFDAAAARIREGAAMLDAAQRSSPFYEVNGAAGQEAVVVPSPIWTLISRTVQLADLSEGSFDPTAEPLARLWNFTPGFEHVPSRSDVEDLLADVDYRRVVVSSRPMTVHISSPGTSVGLRDVWPGFAIDWGMDVLLASGFNDVMLRAGRHVRVHGTAGKDAWRIETPAGDSLMTMSISNRALSTLSDKDRFFVKSNVAYHDILDPQTGYPARRCQSVTVVAPDGLTAEALARAIFAAGPAKGVRMADHIPGVEAFIIDAKGRRHLSARFRQRVPIAQR